ncbi:MAG: tRNA glutamyl-Q(34) synthetase GluQRS [Cycloclasticus sp.]|nr:MAG: tRNA glutamyl-Q(34) synthetase GluQRS [Cycloclasticus sp.]
MSSEQIAYRGRFAPSPTGPLHFGSLYTAVASFLQARSVGGKWLVRIDDLDPLRCKQVYSTHILKTLEQFGLTWDETIFYQSTRHLAYKTALAELKKDNFLYRCSCSRKELTERRIPNGIYDQHCLNSAAQNIQPHALRIKLPVDRLIFNDQIQGDVKQYLKKDVGDFIVFRKDHVAAYHLAVALDDHEQKITDVLRGYDLLASTPRQIMLQQILGLHTPNYAHIPVISNVEGAKLSKQTFADDVSLSPVKQTLISILAYLNLNPIEGLLDGSVSDILSWGIKHWSLNNIKRQPSILFHSN